MGYDFIFGEEENHEAFRWSAGNWKRVLNMASKYAEEGEFKKLLEQENTISVNDAKILGGCLMPALDNLDMPDMSIDDGLNQVMQKLEPTAKHEANIFMFFWPWNEPGPDSKPVWIAESDPRWQGLFFNRLLEFVLFLKKAVMAGDEIHVS